MWDSIHDDLEQLKQSLVVFDGADIASRAAGLQIEPANASCLLRLEVLVALLYEAHGPEQGPKMSAGRWRRLVNGSPISSDEITRLEDPAEDTVTASIGYDGAVFRIFRGRHENSVEYVELLLSALERMSSVIPADEFNVGRATARAILQLSDAVAERAGLGRNVIPMLERSTQVLIPDVARLDTLKRATVFSTNDLVAIVGQSGLAAIKRIVVDAGSLPVPLNSPDDLWRVHLQPVLRFGDRYVVAVPSALPISLAHWLIRWATTQGVREDLTAQFERDAMSSVELELAGMRWTAMPPIDSPPIDWASESIFRFDLDKFAHVVLLADNLLDYEADAPYGQWKVEVVEELNNRAIEIRSRIRNRVADAGVLHMVLLQGVGRPFAVGMNSEWLDDNSEFLMLTPQELSIASKRLAGDPLGLWKYCQAITRFGNGRLVAFSELDKFAEYLKRGKSFYFSDDEAPVSVYLTPDLGAGLVLEDALRYDVHSVLRWDVEGTTKVRRLWDETVIPVYSPIHRSDSVVRMLVENPILPVWVWGSLAHDDRSYEGIQVLLDFCETVAYWLAEVAESIGCLLQRLAPVSSVLQVQVEVSNPTSAQNTAEAFGRDWFEVKSPAVGSLVVSFGPGTAAAMRGPTNVGERLFLSKLIQELADSLPTSGLGEQSIDLETIIEQHAPLGPKKKLLFLDDVQNIPLLPGRLPQVRTLQEADVEAILDDLGPKVASSFPLKAGNVRSADRSAVLNAAVRVCMTEIERRIDQLNPEGLLEGLVANHEAIVKELYRKRLIIPTLRACFGEKLYDPEEIMDQLDLLTHTDQALRFLVEYVAATPPSGTRDFSLAEYDYLVALANQVINKGMLSDAIFSGIADLDVSFLPSGRIGISRNGRYIEGIDKFKHGLIQQTIQGASEHFATHWKSASSDSEPEWVATLNQASLTEFGFTMTDVALFFGELINFSIEEGGISLKVSLAAVIPQVSASLGWEEKQVQRAIETFSLRPRKPFFPTNTASDAWPWRFNRDLSYVRRPLLILGESDETLLWGPRHLFRASPYIADLIFGGQFRAKSPQMRSFMGQVTQRLGEEFNDQVAEEFDKHPEYRVLRRVERFGNKRIERTHGQPLGDIDVLVVDHARHKIIAIETKNFGTAKTPAELRNEIVEFGHSEKSFVSKHLERVAWMRSNSSTVLASLGIHAGSRRWRIEGMFVTSESLVTPYLRDTAMEVLAFSALRSRLGSPNLVN